MAEKKPKKKKKEAYVNPADYVTLGDVDKWVDVDKKGRGHLRWVGEQDFGKGPAWFCGIEMLQPLEGAGDGAVSGTRFFSCDAGHGIFVAQKKVKLAPSEVQQSPTKQDGIDRLASQAAVAATKAFEPYELDAGNAVDLTDLTTEPDWSQVRPTEQELAQTIRDQQEKFLATLDGGQDQLLFQKQMREEPNSPTAKEKWVPEYLKIINDEEAMNKFIDRSKLSSKQLEELDNAEKAAVSIALDRAVERAKREWHAAIAAEVERVAHEEEERLAREAAKLQAKEEAERAEREAREAAERAEWAAEEQRQREEAAATLAAEQAERAAREAEEKLRAEEQAAKDVEEAARRADEEAAVVVQREAAAQAQAEAEAARAAEKSEADAARKAERADIEAVQAQERAAHEEELARVRTEAAQQARQDADAREIEMQKFREEMLTMVRAEAAAAAAVGVPAAAATATAGVDFEQEAALLEEAKAAVAHDQTSAIERFTEEINQRAEEALEDADERIQESIAAAGRDNEVAIAKMMEKMSAMNARLEGFAKLQADNKRLAELVATMEEKLSEQDRRIAKLESGQFATTAQAAEEEAEDDFTEDRKKAAKDAFMAKFGRLKNQI